MGSSKVTLKRVGSFSVGAPVHEHCLTYSPDGNFLLFGGDVAASKGIERHATVEVWPGRAGKISRRLETKALVSSVVIWFPDGSTVGFVGVERFGTSGELRGVVCLYDVTAGKTLRAWALPGFRPRSAVLSPDGLRIALGGNSGGSVGGVPSTGELRLCDARTGTPLWKREHGNNIWSVAFSTDGKLLASSSGRSEDGRWRGGEIRLWDPAKGRELHRLDRLNATAQSMCALSPSGSLIASGDGPDGDVLIWDTQSGKTRATLRGHRGPVYAAAFTPDGKYLVTGSRDRRLGLWDIGTGSLITFLDDHRASVHAIAVARAGNRIATGDLNGTVNLWQTM